MARGKNGARVPSKLNAEAEAPLNGGDIYRIVEPGLISAPLTVGSIASQPSSRTMPAAQAETFPVRLLDA